MNSKLTVCGPPIAVAFIVLLVPLKINKCERQTDHQSTLSHSSLEFLAG